MQNEIKIARVYISIALRKLLMRMLLAYNEEGSIVKQGKRQKRHRIELYKAEMLKSI